MAFNETNKDKRRADRSAAGLQVELVLFDNSEENILAGPSAAFIRDISRYGASLILSRIWVNNHHLFYESYETSSLLYLEKGGPDASRTLSIQVQPKWYRLEADEEGHFFCIGVEFIKAKRADDISQLRKMAKAFVSPEKSWLSSIFST
jgi:hypothetical protein